MDQKKASKPKLVGKFFRANQDLSLKIKLAAFSEGISQQDLINRALRSYFAKIPIDLYELPHTA